MDDLFAPTERASAPTYREVWVHGLTTSRRYVIPEYTREDGPVAFVPNEADEPDLGQPSDLLPSALKRQLRPHWSAWEVVPWARARYLRGGHGGQLHFFLETKKGWVKCDARPHREIGQRAYCVRRTSALSLRQEEARRRFASLDPDERRQFIRNFVHSAPFNPMTAPLPQSGGFGKDDAISIGMDATPILGSAKSIVELVTGKDGYTGEPTSRVIAGVGIVAGLLPGGKALLKGGVKVLTKSADDVGEGVFRGVLRGEEYALKGIRTRRIVYTKRKPDELAELRRAFNNGERKQFLTSIGSDPKKLAALKKAGLSDDEIKLLKDGMVPDGWQVHHKLPLDDGGTNAFDNLLLIKNEPAHKVLTNVQKSLAGGLKSGESKVLDFPVPDGFIYPPRAGLISQ